MGTCLDEKSGDGSLSACVTNGRSVECKKAAYAACKDTAKEAFEAAGGKAKDFAKEQQKAKQSAVRDTIKSCIEEELAAEDIIFDADTDRNCTAADGANKTSTAHLFCIQK